MGDKSGADLEWRALVVRAGLDPDDPYSYRFSGARLEQLADEYDYDQSGNARIQILENRRTEVDAELAGRLSESNLDALYAGLDAVKNVFTGKMEIKGTFTNPFDSTVWIAPPVKANPTNLTQALYAVHRVSGDMGAKVHDATATELIAYSATNTTFLNAFESTVKLEDAGNAINDMRAGTFNFAFSSDAGGTVTKAAIIVAQATPALPPGLTITDLYGLYVENQTRGQNNWSVYAPTGTSLFGNVTTTEITAARLKATGTLGTGVALINSALLVRNAGDTGTFMQLGPTYLQWKDASLQQTTVGAAGAAAALPTAPTKYLKVQDSTGATLVIPAYAAA